MGGAAHRAVLFVGFSTARTSTGGRATSALAVLFWTGGLRARSCHFVWSEITAFSADMSMTRTFRVAAPGAADEGAQRFREKQLLPPTPPDSKPHLRCTGMQLPRSGATLRQR